MIGLPFFIVRFTFHHTAPSVEPLNALRYSGLSPIKKRGSKVKRRKRMPIWLKRLGIVKTEMKYVRFPRTAQEGFRQCAELSETARRWFRQSILEAQPGATEEEVEKERTRLLARFSAAQTHRIAKWKKERDRYFRE